MVSSYLNASLVGQSMFSRLFFLKNHMSFDVIQTIHTEFKFTNQIQIHLTFTLLSERFFFDGKPEFSAVITLSLQFNMIFEKPDLVPNKKHFLLSSPSHSCAV